MFANFPNSFSLGRRKGDSTGSLPHLEGHLKGQVHEIMGAGTKPLLNPRLLFANISKEKIAWYLSDSYFFGGTVS